MPTAPIAQQVHTQNVTEGVRTVPASTVRAMTSLIAPVFEDRASLSLASTGVGSARASA